MNQMNCGKSLRICIAKQDKLKKEVAKDMNISNFTLSKMLKNRSWKGDTINRISEFFGLDPSEFIALGQEEYKE